MSGIPQLREAGWFVTGPAKAPDRHLFLRLEERMDHSGIWTVELHRCGVSQASGGQVMREYPNEADARTAVSLIYALSRYLLPFEDSETSETGRWRTRTVEPSPQDLKYRLKTARVRASTAIG